jgi:hypothetical protein
MKLNKLAIGLILAGASVAASAQVVTVGSRAAFDASGAIAFNSNFADFGAYFAWPGTPFTRGDVTYVSAENLTVGAGTGYSIGDSVTVMSNNYWSPLTATINQAPQYTLLGFDAAVTSGPVSITLTTNQNTYSYTGLTLPDGSPNFAFEGFRTTGSGEYFTGFRIDTLGGGYLPGVTNVAVGVAAVPEPETYAMLFAGLGLLGVMARRRKA